jgi:hypothetical protein
MIARPALRAAMALAMVEFVAACSTGSCSTREQGRAPDAPAPTAMTAAVASPPLGTLVTPTAAPTADVGKGRPLPREIADVPALLPAGLCAFEPYLSDACNGAPLARFAVVLAGAGDRAAAEKTLRRGQALGLAAGYPFAATFDEMPAKDPQRQGIAVVAGLFAEKVHAEVYLKHLPPGTELLELASPQEASKRASAPAGMSWDDFEKTRSEAVVIAEDTPAWSEGDLDRVEAQLDENLAKKWVMPPEQKVRRDRALGATKHRCTIARGRVFTSSRQKLYRFRRTYAPAQCDDGSEVWVEWRATRRESVVTRSKDGAVVHQVIRVECDQPAVETRRFEAGSGEKPIKLGLGGPC